MTPTANDIRLRDIELRLASIKNEMKRDPSDPCLEIYAEKLVLVRERTEINAKARKRENELRAGIATMTGALKMLEGMKATPLATTNSLKREIFQEGIRRCQQAILAGLSLLAKEPAQ